MIMVATIFTNDSDANEWLIAEAKMRKKLKPKGKVYGRGFQLPRKGAK